MGIGDPHWPGVENKTSGMAEFESTPIEFEHANIPDNGDRIHEANSPRRYHEASESMRYEPTERYSLT